MKRTRPAELQEDARESRSQEDGWAQWWAHLGACRLILLSLLQTAVSSWAGTHSASFQNSWTFSRGVHALRYSGSHRVSLHIGVLPAATAGVTHISTNRAALSWESGQVHPATVASANGGPFPLPRRSLPSIWAVAHIYQKLDEEKKSCWENEGKHSDATPGYIEVHQFTFRNFSKMDFLLKVKYNFLGH